MTLYDTVKATIERGIVSVGAKLMAPRRQRGDVLILAYHNIVPDGEEIVGDASLHLPQRAFAQQLDMIQQSYEVVSLHDVDERTYFATRPPNRINRTRPLAVITFDDAYRGALTVGVSELKHRGLPATVFVAPGYIGGKSFWWDILTPPTEKGLATEFREQCLTIDAGKAVEILERAHKDSLHELTPMPRHAQCVHESELTSALTFNLLTLGSHTWSHPNLTELETSELQYELEAPQEWLNERFGDRVVSAISYPYGRSNQEVWNVARSVGYDMGLLVEGGWAQFPTPDRYAIPRLNIPSGVSENGFALRTAGLISR